jgi:hypothetical protein
MDDVVAPQYSTFAHLTADKAGLYREVLGVFADAKARFTLHLRPADVAATIDAPVELPELEAALIAGDLAVMFGDNEAAEDLMQFMASIEGIEGWASFGGTLSPHVDFDPDLYPTEIDAAQQEFLGEAPFARFDASDMMPGAVGAGSFWTQVSRWINGEVSLDDALASIDASWP